MISRLRDVEIVIPFEGKSGTGSVHRSAKGDEIWGDTSEESSHDIFADEVSEDKGKAQAGTVVHDEDDMFGEFEEEMP